MEPGIALEAAKNLGTLLILDVPIGLGFGLDGSAFIAGEKFKGIKMIPTGIHFLSTDWVSQGSLSAPVSTFLFLDRSEILIYRWNARTDQLEELDNEEEIERLRAGVRRFNFDDGLGPYDMTGWRQWQRLSDKIDKECIDRLMNGHRWISIAEEAKGVEGLSPKIPSEAALIDQLRLHRPSFDRPQRLAYVPFPLAITRKECTAAEISALNIDKTDTLQTILDGPYDGQRERLMSEIQFAFVSFLFGQSLSGLEQWKHMLHLMLGCFEGVNRFPHLFEAFLKIMRYQVRCLVDRGDTDDPSEASEMLSNSFLKADLTEFLNEGLEDDSQWPETVKKECRKLQRFVQGTLRWTASPEDDEYAPVVV